VNIQTSPATATPPALGYQSNNHNTGKDPSIPEHHH
jgi:hypothetical protein